ncbi:MAG TPA: flagellar basal body-associated FliL family protein [Gallionella sp.]|nr:flagellar basal body-associated FliL family protein [Gallionella sp.]
MSKAAKPAAPQEEAPKKGKKMLIIIIAAVVLLIGGGAAAFLLLKPAHPPTGEAGEVAAHIEEAPPKFVELGTFTANLMHEDGDRYLQVAISLKVTRPELEEKIKANNPEILHRVNMVLQSKRPSELATFEGKDKLAQQIKAQVEYVLGLRKVAPAIATAEAPVAEGASEVPAPAPVVAPTSAPAETKAIGGIADVLFTSFIIQ